MLEIKIEHFLNYCKVSNFATRSIQSLRVRLNEFNSFINKVPVELVQGISYRPLPATARLKPGIKLYFLAWLFITFSTVSSQTGSRPAFS
jgi:hypothetical protein